MNERKNEGKANDKLPLPFHLLKVDGQISILKSLTDWYGKNKKPVTYRDIGGVHASKTNVSSTLQFFQKIGWLKPGKRGQYLPSEGLVQYFEGFDQELAAKKLAEKILQTTIGQRLSFFLSQKGKVAEDELINYLGSEFSLIKADKNRILRLIELLMKLGALIKHDNEIQLGDEGIKKISPIKEKPATEQLQPPEAEAKVQPNLFFGVLIDANTPEEKIRKVIRIALNEINKVRRNEE